jgi:hypothetical protein
MLKILLRHCRAIRIDTDKLMHLLDVSIITYQYEKYRDVTHENSNDLGRGGRRESVTVRCLRPITKVLKKIY